MMSPKAPKNQREQLLRQETPDIERLIAVVIDCGFAIHDRFGPGLLESAYERLLVALLQRRGLNVVCQHPISLEFDGLIIPDAYRVDLLIEGSLIIELKSVEQLLPVHGKQLLTYLRITDARVGLLMNFGSALFKDGIRRIINNRSKYIAPQKQ